MAKMTDPTDSLVSFQQVLPLGILPLQPGELDQSLQVLRDEPKPGLLRYTYVYLKDQAAAAMALLVVTEPIEDRPCFALGYAVPEASRRQGLATKVVLAGLAELQHGLRRAGILPIFVEAVVGEDNPASRRVALKVFGDEGEPITDSVSGLPAYRYLKRLD